MTMWVQQVAEASHRWRWPFRYRGSRRESAVAQLFEIVMINRGTGLLMKKILEAGTRECFTCSTFQIPRLTI